MNSQLNDLLDDLDPRQLRDLLDWLWVQGYTVTRGSIKQWRRQNNLPID